MAKNMDQIDLILEFKEKFIQAFPVKKNMDEYNEWIKQEGDALIEKFVEANKLYKKNIKMVLELEDDGLKKTEDYEVIKKMRDKHKKTLYAQFRKHKELEINKIPCEKLDEFLMKEGYWNPNKSTIDNRGMIFTASDDLLNYSSMAYKIARDEFWKEMLEKYGVAPFVLWREGSSDYFRIMPVNFYIRYREKVYDANIDNNRRILRRKRINNAREVCNAIGQIEELKSLDNLD